MKFEIGSLRAEDNSDSDINNESHISSPSQSIRFFGTFVMCVGWLAAFLLFMALIGRSGIGVWYSLILAAAVGICGWIINLISKAVRLNEDRNELLEKILKRLDR